MEVIKFDFEYVDAYLSVVDTDKTLYKITDVAKDLCRIFDFEFTLQDLDINELPHIRFSIQFTSFEYSKQHYINVLNAFASEYQILITSSSRLKLDKTYEIK